MMKRVLAILLSLVIIAALFGCSKKEDAQPEAASSTEAQTTTTKPLPTYNPLTGEDGTQEIDSETGNVLLGDIVISIETAVKQAGIYGHSLSREIGFLTVHSMLHLLGYDHEKSSLDERIMREKEESVLEKLGISRELSYTDQEDQ